MPTASGPVFWGLRVNLLWGLEMLERAPRTAASVDRRVPWDKYEGAVGGFPLLSRSTMWLHGKILLLIGDVALESIEVHKDTGEGEALEAIVMQATLSQDDLE